MLFKFIGFVSIGLVSRLFTVVPNMVTDRYHIPSDYTQNKTLVTLEVKAESDNKCGWDQGNGSSQQSSATQA